MMKLSDRIKKNDTTLETMIGIKAFQVLFIFMHFKQYLHTKITYKIKLFILQEESVHAREHCVIENE